MRRGEEVTAWLQGGAGLVKAQVLTELACRRAGRGGRLGGHLHLNRISGRRLTASVEFLAHRYLHTGPLHDASTT